MFGPWSVKPPEPPTPTRKPADPIFACIRHHGDRMFCGRSKETNEWVFGDPHHAAENYDPAVNKIPLGGLQVCKECVVQARAEWAKEAEARAK